MIWKAAPLSTKYSRRALEAVALLLILAVFRLLAVSSLLTPDVFDALGFPPAVFLIPELFPSGRIALWPVFPDDGLWRFRGLG